MRDDRSTPDAIAEIRARLDRASPTRWRAMAAGNCEMEDGLLHAIAEVKGLSRPWNPVWVGWRAVRNHFKTFLRIADAEFIAHAPDDIKRLLALLDAERARSAEQAQEIARLNASIMEYRDNREFWVAGNEALNEQLARKGSALRKEISDV